MSLGILYGHLWGCFGNPQGGEFQRPFLGVFSRPLTLVARIREKHLAWTTEKTYRHWARRLVGFCQESGFRSQDSEEGV